MNRSYSTSRKLPIERLPSKHRALSQKAIEAQDARESKFTQARAEKAEAVIENGRERCGICSAPAKAIPSCARS